MRTWLPSSFYKGTEEEIQDDVRSYQEAIEKGENSCFLAIRE